VFKIIVTQDSAVTHEKNYLLACIVFFCQYPIHG